MARQLEDVRELILLLGEGIYDELISLNLRGDLLFELCALPRPVPLLAVENIKKRNFSSKALKIAYEIILFRRYQWFPLYRKSLDHGMSSIDKCFGVVYVLRTSGREEQGMQLDRALNTLALCDIGWKESVLYLLYKLSNSLAFEPEPVTLSETLEMNLKKMLELSQRYREHSRAVLSCEPGTGFNGWYHAKERKTTTLLSALSRHAAIDSCFMLSLPQYVEGYSFPHTPTLYKPRRDSIFSEESALTPVQQQTDLADPIDLSDSGIGHSEEDTTCSNDSWSSVWSQLDLSEPPQQAHMSITSERPLPYLTEAGPGAFDLVHKVYMRGLLSLAGVSPPLTTPCTMNQLVQSTYCVLHGTPSAHYTLDEETTAFQPTRGLYVVGTSYEACGRILNYFAEIGTFYLRLEQSVHTLLVLGIVYKGIATALQSFLQLFLKSVLQTSESKKYTSLLGVRIALHEELSHLRYLAGLFGVDTRWPLAPSSLPKGVMVLDSLYKASLHSAGTAHAALALSVLRNAMKSFLLYLQQWVFFGVCVDQEEEFGIRENPRALAARDHTHWFEGYSLTDKQFVPLFMSSVVANQIFTCGKALLLLKRCSPGNYVFDQSLKHPKLRIVYSNQNLVDMEKECREYESTVVDYGRKWLVEMRGRKDQQQKERLEATIKERKVLLLEAAQARKLEEEKMATQAALKKAELQRLKDQMEQDKVRRALDVQEEKNSDKKMIEQAVCVEREEDERTRKLKQEAKDELIAYYEQLTFEAEKRERRAIWRKRRIELNQKRKEFILNSSETLGGSDLLEALTVTGGTAGLSSLKTSSENVHLEITTSLPAENTNDDASLENTPRDHPPTDTPSAGSRPTDTPSAGSRPTDTPAGSRPTDTPSAGSRPTDTPSAGSRLTDTPSAGSRPTDTPSAGSRPTDTPSTGSRPANSSLQGQNALLSVHVTPPPDTKTPPPDTKTPPPDTKTPPPDTKTPPPDTETPPPDIKTPPPEETIHQLTDLKVPPIDTPTSSDMHPLEGVVHGGSSASTRGHAPPTVIEGILYPDSQPVPMGTHISTRGQEPPSQIQFLMYPKQGEGGGRDIK